MNFIRYSALFFLLIIQTSFAGDLEDAELAFSNGDYVIALKKYKSAAKRNNAEAQAWVGAMYNAGAGMPKDYVEAAKWFRLAAAQNNAMAQYYLGDLYYYGWGVPQDFSEALRLYKLSSSQGNDLAQHSLGIMYWGGEGVKKNLVLAHMWFNLSASGKNPIHKGDTRDAVAKEMSSSQITEAQKLARDCYLRNFKNC